LNLGTNSGTEVVHLTRFSCMILDSLVSLPDQSINTTCTEFSSRNRSDKVLCRELC